MMDKEPKSGEVFVTPAQAARQITFALSQLTNANAHHEFEHLCRHLTRARISANVVPSTGPVSGGGDQGIDFETYRISGSLEGSTFFGRSTSERWVFACSLEKNIKRKVKEDLQTIASLPEKTDRLYFFTHNPVTVSTKNTLRELAINQFGIGLELMDGNAIAELLCDQDTVWIAERYLDLPSAFVLQSPREKGRWYSHLLELPNDMALVDGVFFKLKDAVREAAYNPEQRSDALKLFQKIRLYRHSSSERIRRKAVYEEFVASLRGLGDPEGYQDDLRSYMSKIPSVTDSADIEDATILISYSLGARVVEGFKLPLDEINDWHKNLTDRIAILLSETDHVPRRCSLLMSKAGLQLSAGRFSFERDPENRWKHLKTAAAGCIETWREVLSFAGKAPLFPFERIAKISDAVVVILDELPGNDRFQKDLTKVLSSRAGAQEAVKRCIARASRFQEAGKKLRGLQELHSAQRNAIEEEDVVLLTLSISRAYAELGLHFASKLYALSSAYAALKLPDEELKSLSYAGAAQAASSDYATGGSCMFVLSAELFLLLASNYSMRGSDKRKEFEWSRFDFHLVQTAHWSHLFSVELQDKLLEKLSSWDVKDIYDAILPNFAKHYKEVTDQKGLDRRTEIEGISPMFSDCGGMRIVSWNQLQIKWIIEWPTIYEFERFAEAFCASLQIVLAELTHTELSLMPGEARIKIELSKDGRFAFKEIPDNYRVSRILRIPAQYASSGAEEQQAAVAAVAFLDVFSAETQKSVTALVTGAIDKNKRNIFAPHVPGPQMFNEFYSVQSYDDLYKVAVASPRREEVYSLPGDAELKGPIGTHPSYSRKDAHDLIRKRYEKGYASVRLSIERLKSSETFRQHVEKLRSEGWKDWHIILAFANIRTNYLGNYRRDESFREARERVHKMLSTPEVDGDPLIPLEVIGIEQIRDALNMAKLASLMNYKLEVRQPTPNFNGVDALLARFNYWSDDVPHDAIAAVLNTNDTAPGA